MAQPHGTVTVRRPDWARTNYERMEPITAVCPDCGDLHDQHACPVKAPVCACCRMIDRQRLTEPELVMLECPTCAGEGRITVEVNDREYERTCPDCDGDGVVTPTVGSAW